jgi:hypothetical protein
MTGCKLTTLNINNLHIPCTLVLNPPFQRPLHCSLSILPLWKKAEKELLMWITKGCELAFQNLCCVGVRAGEELEFSHLEMRTGGFGELFQSEPRMSLLEDTWNMLEKKLGTESR